MSFLLISSWQPINNPDLMILSAAGNFPYDDHSNFLATGCLVIFPVNTVLVCIPDFSNLIFSEYIGVDFEKSYSYVVDKAYLEQIEFNDIENGFIRAETISTIDYLNCQGEAGAKEAGKLRIEGADYIVKDGDIFNFRFNV